MLEFKIQNTISIISLDAIELKIIPEEYGIDTGELLHLIEGEFMYCDLAIDGKLIVTENQLEQILDLQNLSIHKIVDSIIYIHSLSSENRSKFNKLNKQAKYLSTENFDDDLEDDIEIFKLI